MTHNTDDIKYRRQIRTFVHRGRQISESKREVFERLSYKYMLTDFHDLDFRRLFSREAPLVFEIGFGYGDSLLSLAKSHADINYLGAEVHMPGMVACILKLEEAALSNVRIYHGDAFDILNRGIIDNSLSGINLFFPDPWPKWRHRKRRFIQAETVDLLGRKLAIGGFLHLATDWENYANEAMGLLTASPFFIKQEKQADFLSKHRGGVSTKFERRGNKLGHQTWDFYFIRRQ